MLFFFFPYEETFALNHACNFSRARPRWDILFFSAFSISAYLYVDVCQEISIWWSVRGLGGGRGEQIFLMIWA